MRSHEKGRGHWVVYSLRRWWLIPALLGVLGAVAAGVAAPQLAPTASAALLLQTDAADNQAMARQAQSILVSVEASSAIDDAAATLSVDGEDLRQRTRLSVPSEALVMNVETRADTPEEAVRQANAVAAAIVAADAKRLSDRLAEVTATTSELIAKSPLGDKTAESARVSNLAAGMASTQSDLIGNARQLLPLQPASEAPGSSGSRALFVFMGLVGGLLLGCGISYYLGTRRSTVRSVQTLRSAYPGEDVATVTDLCSVVSSSPWINRVVVAENNGPGDPDAMHVLGDALELAGLHVTASSGIRQPITGAPTGNGAGPAGYAAEREVTLTRVPARGAVLRRYAADPAAVVVFPAYPGRTRLNDVNQVLNAASDICLLVLEEVDGAPGRLAGAREAIRATVGSR